ncbi:MAG: hypothetical protein ACN6OP_20105 [Pseudomonadales bacterium]
MAMLRKTIASALAVFILHAGVPAAEASSAVRGIIHFSGSIVTPPLRMDVSRISSLRTPFHASSGFMFELRPQDDSAVSVLVDLPGSHAAPVNRAQCAQAERAALVPMPARGCHFNEGGGRVLLTTALGGALSTVLRVSYD